MRCMHAMVMGVKDEIRVSNGFWLWKMRNALKWLQCTACNCYKKGFDTVSYVLWLVTCMGNQYGMYSCSALD